MRIISKKFVVGAVAALAMLAVALGAGYHFSQRVMAAPLPSLEQGLFGGGGHGHFGNRGFSPERMTAFLTDYLSLTDAQQTQVKTILTNAKPQFDQFHSQLRALHLSVHQAAIVQPFNEANIRSLLTQSSTQMINAGVEMARVQSQIYATLTPEQQAKMEKHFQRMAQHQAPPTGDAPLPPPAESQQ